jgi:hypothetical protein
MAEGWIRVKWELLAEDIRHCDDPRHLDVLLLRMMDMAGLEREHIPHGEPESHPWFVPHPASVRDAH